ncbi:extracellular solute-binding protein [Thioclava sp. SK-1]|uniref:extracellular solute-binding protein n=1 Tax=Thioclava sp. SK-1 TaxID=1889770 RepID=UPI0009F57C3A|nr:extracellular solute-binding protein [Thioclava sp. SK-1]
MRPVFLQGVAAGLLALAPLWQGSMAHAQPQYGIAMYGEPALPEGFGALPYANPDAPKGGRIRMGEAGTFDSLNPYILTGRFAQGISDYTVETLMGRSYDEPFSLYGLLAQSVETDPARTWVEFTLRPQARFSDGSPVTVEDVIWSYETLGTQGHPRYQNSWGKVASIEKTGERTLRITFTQPERELALIMGMRPILQKAQYEGKNFAELTTEAPIGSGPYVLDRVETGKYITFKRDPNWWGKDLAFNQGKWNFDEIRYDYFGDGNVVFEAFKGGEIDIWRELNSAKWNGNYDFPAVQSGEIVKDEIPHQRPSGINGLAFNTRKDIFKDWRVRQALIDVFNFEFMNQALNDGSEPRITSYFSNSPLGMSHDAAQGRVAQLLQPFADSLPPGTIEGYSLPVSDGKELNRKNARKALKLLGEAGWTVADDGVLRNDQGAPFNFEILLRQGGGYWFGPYDPQPIIDIYVEALSRIGIFPKVTTTDDAQYVARTKSFDFDMAWHLVALSLSPGNEQKLYWGSQGVDQPGSRNWMGIDSPAVDALTDALLNAGDQEEFIATAHALDRVLTAGRYIIPAWYSKFSRLAHIKQIHYPETLPLYGDWTGFLPDVWWYEETQ